MPTYRTTARNQFRSPSGAVGEAPDGPGAMATMLDDVDNYLGVGGAEYCANAAAVAAIPAGRLFAGKLIYRADQDCVYRYVGVGNTALRGNDTTHPWQAWFQPAKPFTPVWTAVTLGAATVQAQYGINAGMAWADVNVVGGTGFAINSTATDVSVSPIPTGMICGFGVGVGLYSKGGTGGNNNQIDLAAYPTGTNGQASSSIRLRARYVNVAPGPATLNVLGSVVTSTATDAFQFGIRCPAASVM